ncbi:MAG: AAA family ATPase [Elusimicrobiales bacterium]|nr:AAA family ATPase [Elusimicrobiales bacterium]
MELSEDQKFALESLLAWHRDGRKSKYITLGGYAGTGKTTLMAILRQELYRVDPSLRIAFCSYTGRAARNLEERLEEHRCLLPNDKVSTIHRLIYSPIESPDGNITGWVRAGRPKAGLIVLDEASMADAEIWHDLMSYGIPIIAVGDHGQLPPINGKFNLMEKPDLALKHIHRQAEGNPIIEVSKQARETGAVKPGTYGPGVKKILRSDELSREAIGELLENFHNDTLILCGYNSTRLKINAQIRQNMGFESPDPSPGDRVICLKNNHRKGIYNGMLGTIIDIYAEHDGRREAQIQMDGVKKTYHGFISASQFGSKENPNSFHGYGGVESAEPPAAKLQSLLGGIPGLSLGMKKTADAAQPSSREIPSPAGAKTAAIMRDTDYFDFGYALTVHKAQGSQARKVIMLEERFPKMDDETWRRWLYTGVTRAQEELYLFGD